MKEPIIRTHNREIDELFERYRRAPGSHVFAPLADAYRKLGLVEEALDICARGLSANPRYASGWVVQGKCEYDAGNPERAEASFKRVLEIDAHNLVALRYLGIIRASCGDPDAARAHFEHILTLDPSDKEIRQRLDAVLESTHVTADTLVEEIEQVLQPPVEEKRSTPAAPAPAPERVHVARADDRTEDRSHERSADRPYVRKESTPAPQPEIAREEEAVELPDVPEELVGAPIILSDDAETSEYIATVTLADIFANQGYSAKALKIYEDVLRRQPNNDEVRRKMAALQGEPATDVSPDPKRAAESPSPAPISPAAPTVASASAAAPQPATGAASPTGPAIDEGRSYEQFKRWLRSVSD
jgi:tetratricopeptide (TPR) repeat protein